MIDELTRDKVDRIRAVTVEEAKSSIALAYDVTLKLVLDEDRRGEWNAVQHFHWVCVPSVGDEGVLVDLYPARLHPECCPSLEEWLERYVIGQVIRRAESVRDYRQQPEKVEEPEKAEESE